MMQAYFGETPKVRAGLAVTRETRVLPSHAVRLTRPRRRAAP